MKNDVISKIQERWGKLSRATLLKMDDMRELVTVIEGAYGYPRNRAEREYHEFHLTLRPAVHPAVTFVPFDSRRSRKFSQS
jgi:hypothetical protein